MSEPRPAPSEANDMAVTPSSLIQPVRQGEALLAEIATTRPEPGSIAVWWLGQSGFLIKSASSTIVVDPYLSESLTRKYAASSRPHIRMTAAPCRGSDLSSIDLLVASHKHSDHLDPETALPILAASPACRLVLPSSLVDHARSLGIPPERMIGLDAGESVRVNDRDSLRAIPSAHEQLDTDAQGRHLYLGFVLQIEGLRLYHSGDSVLFDALPDWIGPVPPDVMFLPINGRDPNRGVPGNMTAAEAVDLAARVRPRYIAPHHYDMFTFNTVSVDEFRAESRRLPPGVEAIILRCGQRWEVRR